jgi:hypothetical protein
MLSRSEASRGPAQETLRCGSELALNEVNGVAPAGSCMCDHAVMLSRSEASHISRLVDCLHFGTLSRLLQ